MLGIVQHVSMVKCDSPDEAIQQGYVYRKDNGYNPIHIDQAVVVKGGMQSGAATVDFVLHDEAGQKYVVMITANLLKAILALGGE